jgi:hypothetical protein
MAKYSVEYWGSHPDDDNDDCHTGSDHDTIEEARAAFLGPLPTFCEGVTAYVWLVENHENQEGDRRICVTVVEDRYVKRTKPRRSEDDDREWQREQAHQAGMAFGCQGYNDAMGWDAEPYEVDQ